MTLIKFSAIVSEVSGKLNGSIFSRNRSGAIIKNRMIPINRQSSTQQPNRINWSFLIRTWNSLSVEQINTWNVAALTISWQNKLGDSYHPSGQQLFLYCNQNLYTIGFDTILSYVAPRAVELITSASVYQNRSNPSEFLLSFSPSPTPTTVIYKLYATPALSYGINYAKKYLREICLINGYTPSPYLISPQYEARFGSFVYGKQIFFKLVAVEKSSGFHSPPFYFNYIVTNYRQPHPFQLFGFSF